MMANCEQMMASSLSLIFFVPICLFQLYVSLTSSILVMTEQVSRSCATASNSLYALMTPESFAPSGESPLYL